MTSLKVLRVLASEFDGGRVDVLSNPAHVFIGSGASGIHLFGVHTVLGVQILDFTVGEDAVDASIKLEFGSELREKGKALFLTCQLQQIGSLPHDSGSTCGHLEDLFLLALPGDDMEFFNLSLAQKAACKKINSNNKDWELNVKRWSSRSKDRPEDLLLCCKHACCYKSILR